MPPGPPASFERLRSTARDLVSLTTAAPERLGRVPAAGEWSAAMVLSHLADAELVWGFRLRQIVAGGDPNLTLYDENAWVGRFAELDADSRQSLARWRPLREANLRIFDSLADDEWQMTGRHPEHGVLTVAMLADLLANHDREHLGQLRETLAR